MRRLAWWLMSSVLAAVPAAAAVTPAKVDFPLRGKTLTLTVYTPSGTPRGTIMMGSGDVGWVGLAATMADVLSAEGWTVVGVNVRQYLSSFTGNTGHLTVAEPPVDYRAMADYLASKGLARPPFVISGVSEGAALAVLVAAAQPSHQWVRGVVTMGIPPSAELAWKWTDFTAWITKSDAREPSFAPAEYIAAVSPIPLWMLQSKKDEYVPEADYRQQAALAREPKRQVLIDASNHRFTDRRKELRQAYLEGLDWILKQPPASP